MAKKPQKATRCVEFIGYILKTHIRRLTPADPPIVVRAPGIDDSFGFLCIQCINVCLEGDILAVWHTWGLAEDDLPEEFEELWESSVLKLLLSTKGELSIHESDITNYRFKKSLEAIIMSNHFIDKYRQATGNRPIFRVVG